jgi:hypothetical protein
MAIYITIPSMESQIARNICANKAEYSKFHDELCLVMTFDARELLFMNARRTLR